MCPFLKVCSCITVFCMKCVVCAPMVDFVQYTHMLTLAGTVHEFHVTGGPGPPQCCDHPLPEALEACKRCPEGPPPAALGCTPHAGGGLLAASGRGNTERV